MQKCTFYAKCPPPKTFPDPPPPPPPPYPQVPLTTDPASYAYRFTDRTHYLYVAA
ncbi:MAG: hypothetical protein GY820_31770 [Gammaproteobacteria bacterium]|nr:hypothetical protein [Gammaproteobacteria bacterium]